MKYILRKCTVLLMAAALVVGSAGCVFAADVSADPCLQSGAPEESVSEKWTDYQDHWARYYIDTVTERGYMTSTGGYFAPDEPISTEEINIILQRAGKKQYCTAEEPSRLNAAKIMYKIITE